MLIKNQIVELITSELEQYRTYFKAHKPFIDSSVYASWCAQTYYYTSHTCRLLDKAGLAVENPTIKETFLAHVDEEMGHETLSKLDYKMVTKGGKVTDFPEFQETKDFWGYIDSEIDVNPMSMFGYALSLEFLACELGELLIDQASVHGKRSVHFLKEHHEVDQEHTKIMIAMLDNLNEEELKVVYEATQKNFDAYRLILDKCNNQRDLQRSA